MTVAYAFRYDRDMKHQPEKKITKKRIGIGIGVIVLLIIVGYFFNLEQERKRLQVDPQAAAAKEVKTLVGSIAKLYELPSDETPTVATVSDVNQLKGQDFFSRALNGDKVLIFTKAKKAVLYRPSTRKIVEIGPVNNTHQTPSPQASQSAQTTPTVQAVKVALYNGTSTVGLTRTIEAQLKEGMPNVTVVAKENAAKNTYEKTLVIDLNGNQPTSATQLATQFKGEVGSLPEGEERPEGADILVILGTSATKAQ